MFAHDRLFCHVLALECGRRLYAPSIAASKERIVSRGRSNRDRVGLDRSGSAGQVLARRMEV